MALTLLVFESLNLILLYLLGRLVQQPAIRLAWVYSSLCVPVFFWLGNFDSLTTFFMLLTMYLFLRNRHLSASLALSLGVMVKYVPIILLAPIWRFGGLRRTAAYILAVVLVSLAIFGPFFLISPEYAWASLQVQVRRASYETIWALIDGNYTTGNLGPLLDHFDPSKAAIPLGNPPRVPIYITVPLFAAFYLILAFRSLKEGPQAFLAHSGVALTLFFLWSKGWSPQWQTFLLPLILLVLPVWRAFLFCLTLSTVNFLEWPVLLSRGLNWLPLTVLPRTLIFVLLLLEFQRWAEGRSTKGPRATVRSP